jgi:hypothetical protein
MNEISEGRKLENPIVLQLRNTKFTKPKQPADDQMFLGGKERNLQ